MPINKRLESRRGPSGKCSVRVLKDGTVKIVAENGEVYEIQKENVGRGVVVVEDSNLFFRLSPQETALYGLTPWDGAEFIKFTGFLKRDGVAAQRIAIGGERQNRQTGARYYVPDRVVFDAMFEIVGGKHAGMTTMRSYPYIFHPREDGSFEIVGTARQLEEVETFLTLLGFDSVSDNVAFAVNLLPALETVLLEKGVVVMGTFENGWLRKLSRVPEGVAFEKPKRKAGRPKKVSKSTVPPKSAEMGPLTEDAETLWPSDEA